VKGGGEQKTADESTEILVAEKARNKKKPKKQGDGQHVL